RAILATAEPLERLKLAVRATRLPKGEFSRVIADSLAQLPIGSREAAIVHLFETGTVGRLNAAVASQIGESYRDIATPADFSETIHASHGRYRTWSRLKDLLARLNPADPRAHLQANALAHWLRFFLERHCKHPRTLKAPFTPSVKPMRW
ncbi:MAG: hypothetical protein EBS61_08800, partial [Betaproteobacteria bacterium]|nr:hypothetical protein [Betaproteobacteria bacterium]